MENRLSFFNAARALITPEGIKAMDKYNKTISILILII
jgi:hypothetical protein